MARKLAAYALALGIALAGMSAAVVARYRAAPKTGTAVAVAPARVPLLASAGDVTLALLTPPSAASRAPTPAQCLRTRAQVLAPSLALGRPGPAAATPAYVTEARLEAGQVVPGLRRAQLRGFSPADTELVSQVRFATVLHLRPEAPALTALEDAMRLVAACAARSGGLVADPSTGEIFTPRAFRERRVGTWERGLPSLPDQVVVAPVALPDGRVELRTAGLVKFGLPELALDAQGGVEPRLARVVGLAAQTLVEQGALDPAGLLSVDPLSLRHSRLRATPPASACPSADRDRAELSWRLEEGASDDGAQALGALGLAAAVGGEPRARTRRLALTLLPREADVDDGDLVACEATPSPAQAAAPAQD
jgi:hypothetical protein